MTLLKTLIYFASYSLAYGVDLQVRNNCGFPIWLATLPNYGQNPLPDGTVQLNTGASHTFNVITNSSENL